MIRAAAEADLEQIGQTYEEHFLQEERYGAYTVFQRGVYPTGRDAAAAVQNGTLYLCEENGIVLGSMIFDSRQPEEYRAVRWPSGAPEQAVRVIHLLLVRPSAAGRGVGSALVRYALGQAAQCDCAAVRLDTGAQNLPAAALYRKLGFRLAAAAPMKVGGAICHGEHLFFEKAL